MGLHRPPRFASSQSWQEINLGFSDQIMEQELFGAVDEDMASRMMSRSVEFRNLMFKYINVLFFLSYPLFAFLIRLLYRCKGHNFTEIFASVLLVNGQLNLLKMVLIFVALLSPAWPMGWRGC